MQKSKDEFYSLVQDIIDNEDFNKLADDLHHGITRYDHLVRVAYYSFLVSKFLKLNYVETTRAALLHDFYSNEELKGNGGLKKLRVHPNVALNNSLKYFELDNVQKDIIKSHMFPCTLSIPKYKESWLVSGVDKIVSTYEMVRYKISLYLGIYLLFLFEILTIPR